MKNKKKLLLLFTGVILVIILSACLKKEVVIISHRGSPIDFPDHSFAGYDDAIEKGSKFIEQDLILSKDGKLVVSHDNNLEKATQNDLNITEMTVQDFSDVKLSNGENIHTLDEVFDRYGSGINYVVETKQANNPNFQMEAALTSLVRERKLEKNIIFQSFSLKSLQYLKKEFSENQFMLLTTDLESIINFNLDEVDILCIYYINLNKEVIEEIHQMGKKAYAYTANEESDMIELVEFGIDGFFTDNTELGLKYSQVKSIK